MRPLNHGRFLSVIPTRSVAEGILGPQILPAVRKKLYDIDGAAEAIWRHVHPDKEPPSKNSDSTQLFQPMIGMMLASILYSIVRTDTTKFSSFSESNQA